MLLTIQYAVDVPPADFEVGVAIRIEVCRFQ